MINLWTQFIRNEDIQYFSFLYNLLNIEDEKYIKLSKKYKKTVITRSPLNSGLLTNHFSKDLIFLKSDFRFEYFSGKNFEIKKKKIIELQKKFKIKKKSFFIFVLFFDTK